MKHLFTTCSDVYYLNKNILLLKSIYNSLTLRLNVNIPCSLFNRCFKLISKPILWQDNIPKDIYIFEINIYQLILHSLCSII